MGDIFGRNPVLEALKSKRTINKIWLAKGEQKGSVHEILAPGERTEDYSAVGGTQ